MANDATKNGVERKPQERKPAREFRAGLSKDGKYWLFRDTTTWFIPVNYLAAILASASAKSKDTPEAVGGVDRREE